MGIQKIKSHKVRKAKLAEVSGEKLVKVKRDASKKKEKKIKTKPIKKKKSVKKLEERINKEDIKLKANAAVNVIYELLKKQEKKSLFAGTGTKLKLAISSVKINPSQKGQIKIDLPYPFYSRDHGSHICLVTKDKRGFHRDHEDTLNDYKNLLHESKINYISEVIPLRQLKTEYKPTELKNRLSNRADILLADGAIIQFLPPLLGKEFYKKKRFPVKVNLSAADLDKEFKKALHRTYLPVNNYGTSSMVQVGLSTQSAEEIICNIEAVCLKLAECFPGGWHNIRNIYLKTDELSISIPIHVSFVEHNAVIRERKKRDPDIPIIDELSTLEKGQVAVYEDGRVQVLTETAAKRQKVS